MGGAAAPPSRTPMFWNLSPPIVDGDDGMRSRKHSSNNRITS